MRKESLPACSSTRPLNTGSSLLAPIEARATTQFGYSETPCSARPASDLRMTVPSTLERRSQHCARCGGWMFDYYRSADGHFGVLNSLDRKPGAPDSEVHCPVCGARYRMRDQLDPLGQPMVRL